LQPDLALLVHEICDRCQYHEGERAKEGLLLAQLWTPITLNEADPQFKLVRHLVALRNRGRLSELDAAILIARVRRLGSQGLP
jgi:hypothetical protein